MTSATSDIFASRKAHLQQLLAQAWPIYLGQIAIIAQGIIDTIMAGHASANDLAAIGVGTSIFGTVYIAISGILIALMPLIARKYGAGGTTEIGEFVRQGLYLSLILSLVTITALLVPDPFFLIAKVSPLIEAKTRLYLSILAASIPAVMMTRVIQGYMASVLQATLVMKLNFGGLALKLFLNFLFIYWLPGGPEQTAERCALSTTATNWIVLGAGIWLCSRHAALLPFAVFAKISKLNYRNIREILALGIPIGITFFIDYTSITFVGLLIAGFGATATAAHQIASSFSLLSYLIPLAVGNAASVLVGKSLGSNRAQDVKQFITSALSLGLILALMVLVITVFGAHHIASLFTKDSATVTLTAALVGVIGFFHFFDAFLTIANAILRAYKKTLLPTFIYFISMWGIGVGVGYNLAISQDSLLRKILGLNPISGPLGFWVALTGGAFVGALLSLIYLVFIYRRFNYSVRQ